MEMPTSTLLIMDESAVPRYRLGVDNVKYGVHLGMFVLAQMNHFFIQPELLFNTVTVDYSIEDFQTTNGPQIRDELYRNLDIPLLLGPKFGPVRIEVGPVGHLFLDSTSDLLDYTDKPKFNLFSWGWQAGIGLDIWKLHLDARYEGNTSYFGDHFVFFGHRYHFSEKPARVLISAGISF